MSLLIWQTVLPTLNRKVHDDFQNIPFITCMFSSQRDTTNISVKCAIDSICWIGLKGLDSLVLAHNQLREVPARVFSHLTQLNSLELDGNQITHVDPDAFIGLEGKIE